MRVRFLQLCAAVTVCGALFAGCDIKLPIKEMADAKAAISKAQKYQAEKYAPEELKAASDALLLTHDQIKNNKEKESLAAATDAKTKAEAAFAKAIPLLAKDTIDEAKKVLAEAKGLYSDEFAPDETKNSEKLIGEADVSYDAKSYLPAYEKADGARSAAFAARDKALARIPALKSRLAELEGERDTLKKQNAAAYADKELQALDTDLAEAKTSLDGNAIRNAVISLATASEWINKIKFMGAGAIAQEKIARAESASAKVKASPYAKDFSTEIGAADVKITDAKTALGGGKPDDAGLRADEALAILDAVVIEIAKKDEEAKSKIAASSNDTKIEPKKDGETKPAELDSAVHYIVQWRKRNTDCLWRIADKLYKNARLWPIIFMANRSKIKDPDLIYPGQKLLIPPAPKKKKVWELDKPIPIPQSQPDEQASPDATQPETKTEPAQPAKDDAKKDAAATTTEKPSDDAVAPEESKPAPKPEEKAEPTSDTPADDVTAPASDQPADETTTPETTETTPDTENGTVPETSSENNDAAPQPEETKPATPDSKNDVSPETDKANPGKTNSPNTSDTVKEDPESPLTKGTSAESSEEKIQ